jgi:ribosome-interacting GTPase 1
VAKTGDARIGFVGFPSVGKSTLLSNLAGVYSEVAAYEFTTLTTVPGVIRYKGAKIQVLYVHPTPQLKGKIHSMWNFQEDKCHFHIIMLLESPIS